MAKPRSLSAKQRAFCAAILAGRTNADAYVEARSLTNRSDISRDAARKGGVQMKRSAAVQKELGRVQAKLAAKAELGVEDLIARLEVAYEFAMASDPVQVSGAVAAIMGVAKLAGLVVDRRQVAIEHKPSISSKKLELDENEWRRQFDPGAKELPKAKANGDDTQG
jgi:hypothetical protein